MYFKEWFDLTESVNITHIDPEDDWEQAEVAYQIAKSSGIRPGRNKEPTIVALDDNENVIGAVFTSWENDQDASDRAGYPVAKWDFDVVVDPKWRGNQLVGIKLIQQAEQERKNLEASYGQAAYTRLWVVNPRLAQLLQSNKFNYNADATYDDGSAHLTKY